MYNINQFEVEKDFKFVGFDAVQAKDWVTLRKIKELQPWIRAMEKTPQDPIWHSEGDVWTHTKMVFQELLKNETYQGLPEELKHVMVASVFFHDIEKPTCTIEVPKEESDLGRDSIQSPNHAVKGENSSRHKLYRLTACPAAALLVGKLVRYHGVGTRFANEDVIVAETPRQLTQQPESQSIADAML